MDTTVTLPDDEVAFLDAAADALGLEQSEVIRVALGVLRDQLSLNGRKHAIELARANPAPWASDLLDWINKVS
ncbi:ribbon-helix-helix protein, CopG family [Pseudonocardia sp.]|uniref:ribbon-helix-helix protein, CopG family n=1 Tax=Pseudonocardia sp. TaxID=60912 RepID=UPI003D148170